MWLQKKLVKIVTTDAIYTNMGITSISIKKSAEIGYAREIQLKAQKVEITKKKTVKIPEYSLKSGGTAALAGAANTSKPGSGSSGKGSGSSSMTAEEAAKKSQSLLYGVASNMELY